MLAAIVLVLGGQHLTDVRGLAEPRSVGDEAAISCGHPVPLKQLRVATKGRDGVGIRRRVGDVRAARRRCRQRGKILAARQVKGPFYKRSK